MNKCFTRMLGEMMRGSILNKRLVLENFLGSSASRKIVVVLNNADYKVYENIHLEKWDVFENYFKAGNYFQSRDEGSFAKVSFFELEVSH